MEVGTGTTDASMDEWLEVRMKTQNILSLCILFVSLFYIWTTMSMSPLYIETNMMEFVHMFRELHILNLLQASQRRRSERASASSPL